MKFRMALVCILVGLFCILTGFNAHARTRIDRNAVHEARSTLRVERIIQKSYRAQLNAQNKETLRKAKLSGASRSELKQMRKEQKLEMKEAHSAIKSVNRRLAMLNHRPRAYFDRYGFPVTILETEEESEQIISDSASLKQSTSLVSTGRLHSISKSEAVSATAR